ncbi:hypothetical protein VL20_5101 [Microcystis panniformis FACHB-1757]|uniref:Uncharacterized protein n=1 Tax=Microcystis panniformis FACHB-1757 TaxID=1638788 RepID=A0A0K1S7J2_9CHRO|nr:hypothetical protein VL20_5101 [Microcystis panniformis FACHB-1757]
MIYINLVHSLLLLKFSRSLATKISHHYPILKSDGNYDTIADVKSSWHQLIIKV